MLPALSCFSYFLGRVVILPRAGFRPGPFRHMPPCQLDSVILGLKPQPSVMLFISNRINWPPPWVSGGTPYFHLPGSWDYGYEPPPLLLICS
jgi:hypothetical protein